MAKTTDWLQETYVNLTGEDIPVSWLGVDGFSKRKLRLLLLDSILKENDVGTRPQQRSCFESAPLQTTEPYEDHLKLSYLSMPEQMSPALKSFGYFLGWLRNIGTNGLLPTSSTQSATHIFHVVSDRYSIVVENDDGLLHFGFFFEPFAI